MPIHFYTAYDADNGPKELYLVKGATYVDLYDKEPYVSEAVGKLAEHTACFASVGVRRENYAFEKMSTKSQ